MLILRFSFSYQSIHPSNFLHSHVVPLTFMFIYYRGKKEATEKKLQKQEFAKIFAKLPKAQQEKELGKVRNLIGYGHYITKENNEKNPSEAFQTFRLIHEKHSDAEVLCYYFCSKCPEEQSVYFADPTNGTGFLVRHHRKHKSEEESTDTEDSDEEVAEDGDKNDVGKSVKRKTAQQSDDGAGTSVKPKTAQQSDGVVMNAPKNEEQNVVTQPAKLYTIDATELAKALADMSMIGYSSGPIKESVIHNLLPDVW